MLALFCRRLFLGAVGFSTAGVPLMIHGRPVLIYARLSVVISDGDGLRLAYCWRGASSIHACLRHFNVLKKDTDLAGRVPGYCEITCHDPEAFKCTSTEKFHETLNLIVEAHARLQPGGIDDAMYKRILFSEGFNYVPNGLPYDETLRTNGVDVFQAIRKDWMHSSLQDGMLTVDSHLYVTACDRVGKGYGDVERFMQREWCFPKVHQSKGRQLFRIFSACRANADGEHDKLRASASELLGMYVLLRHWAETEVGDREEVALERSSFDAACAVIDIIMMAKKQLLPMQEASRLLKQALTSFMQRHKRAYGTRNVRPKHHWMFDVAEQMLYDMMVFDQLIVERLHLTVKIHGVRCQNLDRYERSVLSGVLNTQLAKLRAMKSTCCLADEKTAKLDGFDNADIADNMEVLGMHISVGDLVFHNKMVGRVCACVSELGEALAIVETLRFVADISKHCTRWQRTGQLRVWRALELEQALSHLPRYIFNGAALPI